MERGVSSASEDVDLDVLGETISFFVRSLDIAISRDLDERFRGLEVAKGKGKVTTLLLIDRHPGIRPSELAARSMKDRAQIARIIEHFIANDLVTRRMSDSDNRVAELCVTPAGAALAREVRAIIVKQETEFYADLLPPEDHDAVVRLLRGIYLKLLDRRGLK
ncbi:MAG: MarR family winged helix-turn-helix transcriptional regulator [Pikeienuella sp.]